MQKRQDELDRLRDVVRDSVDLATIFAMVGLPLGHAARELVRE
jgi:hypothetical protein